MNITPGVIRCCTEMAEAEAREEYEDAEIVGAGGEYWLGLRRVAPQTVNRMLHLCLLRADGIGTGCERYTLNEDGKGVAQDPTGYVPRILRPNAALSCAGNKPADGPGDDPGVRSNT